MRRDAIAIAAMLMGASGLFGAPAHAQDRYGPATPAAAQAVATADMPTLTWPGKAAPEAADPAPPSAPAALTPQAPPAVAAVPGPRPPTPPAAPAPAAPIAPAPVTAAATTGSPPHRYADRQHGPTPDPVPLTAQFFTDNASTDLAAPPPPLAPHPTPGAQTVTSAAAANTPANRARAIALDTASPDDTGD